MQLHIIGGVLNAEAYPGPGDPNYPDQGLPGGPVHPDHGLPSVPGVPGHLPAEPPPGVWPPISVSHPIQPAPPGTPPGTIWPPVNPDLPDNGLPSKTYWIVAGIPGVGWRYVAIDPSLIATPK